MSKSITLFSLPGIWKGFRNCGLQELMDFKGTNRVKATRNHATWISLRACIYETCVNGGYKQRKILIHCWPLKHACIQKGQIIIFYDPSAKLSFMIIIKLLDLPGIFLIFSVYHSGYERNSSRNDFSPKQLTPSINITFQKPIWKIVKRKKEKLSPIGGFGRVSFGHRWAEDLF